MTGESQRRRENASPRRSTTLTPPDEGRLWVTAAAEAFASTTGGCVGLTLDTKLDFFPSTNWRALSRFSLEPPSGLRVPGAGDSFPLGGGPSPNFNLSIHINVSLDTPIIVSSRNSSSLASDIFSQSSAAGGPFGYFFPPSGSSKSQSASIILFFKTLRSR